LLNKDLLAAMVTVVVAAEEDYKKYDPDPVIIISVTATIISTKVTKTTYSTYSTYSTIAEENKC